MKSVSQSDNVHVVLCEKHNESDWAAYIEKSAHAVLAHQLEWRFVVEETFGHQSFYLTAYRQQRIVGVLPLFFVNSIFFGRFLVTSPFLTFGGIISDDEEAECALVEKAIQLTRELNADYLEIRNEIPCGYISNTKCDYYTLVIDLSNGEEKIWNSLLHPTARRNIKKARKAGLEVVESQRYLDDFVEINARNMRRLGTPAHNGKFFRNILKYFPESILLMVRYKEISIGGMLLVKFKDTILMPWVGSLQEYFHMRPNNLLYWNAIVRACRDGFRFLDFGRSKWDSGTFRFKQQYGAQPKELYYQFFLNKAKKIPDIDPENNAFKPLISIWRRLPLPVVNSIGPHIICNIP